MVINTSITDIDTISVASKRAGEADRSECTISDTLRNDVAGLFVHPMASYVRIRSSNTRDEVALGKVN